MAYQISCARPSSVTVAPVVEQSPGGTDQNPPSLLSLFAGEGVNTSTAEFTYSHADLVIPGRGPALAFVRTYNGTAIQSGDFPFSSGWTHSYNIRVRLPQAGSADVDLIGPPTPLVGSGSG